MPITDIMAMKDRVLADDSSLILSEGNDWFGVASTMLNLSDGTSTIQETIEGTGYSARLFGTDRFDIYGTDDYTYGAGYQDCGIFMQYTGADAKSNGLPYVQMQATDTGGDDYAGFLVSALTTDIRSSTILSNTTTTSQSGLYVHDQTEFGGLKSDIRWYVGVSGHSGSGGRNRHIGLDKNGTFLGASGVTGGGVPTKWQFESLARDGAASIGYEFDTDDALATAGALHTSWKNSASQLASLDYLGGFTSTALEIAATGSSTLPQFQIGNASSISMGNNPIIRVGGTYTFGTGAILSFQPTITSGTISGFSIKPTLNSSGVSFGNFFEPQFGSNSRTFILNRFQPQGHAATYNDNYTRYDESLTRSFIADGTATTIDYGAFEIGAAAQVFDLGGGNASTYTESMLKLSGGLIQVGASGSATQYGLEFSTGWGEVGNATANAIYSPTGMTGRFLWQGGTHELKSDSSQLKFGAALDAELYYDGTDMKLTTDLQAASDFVIDCGTQKTVELAEIVYDDVVAVAGAIRLGGAAPAQSIAYRGGLVTEFVDTVDMYAYPIFQLPHRYAEGQNIPWHLHWTIDTSGSGGGAENVKWDVTYSCSNPTGSWPVQSTASITVDVQNDAQHDHLVDTFVTITGAGFTVSNCMITSIKRDTSVANNFSGHCYLVSTDLHCPINTMGSRQEWTK